MTNSNTIEVNIGGKVRYVKVGMMAMQFIGELVVKEPEILYNPIKRVVKVLQFCLNANPKNEMPKDQPEEQFYDWLDDMDQEEWEKVETFISTALVFTVQTLNQKMESLLTPTQ